MFSSSLVAFLFLVGIVGLMVIAALIASSKKDSIYGKQPESENKCCKNSECGKKKKPFVELD